MESHSSQVVDPVDLARESSILEEVAQLLKKLSNSNSLLLQDDLFFELIFHPFEEKGRLVPSSFPSMERKMIIRPENLRRMSRRDQLSGFLLPLLLLLHDQQYHPGRVCFLR